MKQNDVEYHGTTGSTEDCRLAVMRLVQTGVSLPTARLVTSSNKHALVLTTQHGNVIAVKSGFASGYGGEGPRGLSLVLQLLDSHGSEIDEVVVDAAVLERLDGGSLRGGDLTAILKGAPVRPSRWHEYIGEKDLRRAFNGRLWHEFPEIVPFAIIDERIMDIARDLSSDPGGQLNKAYCRLEDFVRKRTGSRENGTRLFAQTFNGDHPVLTWPEVEKTERLGRAQLFAGVYMAYRNPRAHREKVASAPLAEFLLVNQLFRLEAEAVAADASFEAEGSQTEI